MCLPRVTAATVCDHVNDDDKLDPELFFTGPFQSLCKGHHDSAKQREERLGFDGTADATGWPADPRHPCNGGPIR
jgi:hypothetical protein